MEEYPAKRLKIWYSYSTPIAFEKNGEMFVSENLWSVTTARHIGYLQHDKKLRLNRSFFEEMLAAAKAGACPFS